MRDSISRWVTALLRLAAERGAIWRRMEDDAKRNKAADMGAAARLRALDEEMGVYRRGLPRHSARCWCHLTPEERACRNIEIALAGAVDEAMKWGAAKIALAETEPKG